jgi:hypothetical protein
MVMTSMPSVRPSSSVPLRAVKSLPAVAVPLTVA